MAGRRNFQELIEKLPPAAQRKARAIASHHLAQMELGELREQLQITQQDLAKKLKVSQVAVSRLERRHNMKLATLREMIEAMGGELEIRAIFENRTVKLNHLGTARA